MDLPEFRESGHRLIDLLAEHLQTIHSEALPVFKDTPPDELAKRFDEPLPRTGEPLDTLIARLERDFLPFCTHVNHPGYFGLITPSPTPAGILGDLMASALNQNVGAWSIGPSAVTMERQVLRWLCDLVGFGAAARGNLTSGGMMANFTGLKLARDFATGNEAQHAGIRTPLAAYTSEERHVSVDKAADCVGIGRDHLRVLPTDERFRIRLDLLEEAIARDRAAGVRPACIVAMGGSTNTGAIDDLQALRRIATTEKIWLHVDCAYGGGMLLSRRSPGLLAGVEAADSVTIDPHKWFFAPLAAGAILVKDGEQLTRSFGMKPPYLTDESDAKNERYDFYVHSFEQSRRFRALKVWLSFKRYGAEQIGDWVDANVDQARHLHERCVREGFFAPAVWPPMSAICIRYAERALAEEALAPLHAEVAHRTALSGRFWIATTSLKGKSWLRINPVNFRTRREHLDELYDFLLAECRKLAK